MNGVLTTKDIWEIAKKLAQSAKTRKLAIAYVTEDHIGLRSGDVLVCDASDRMIRMGQTDAKLLRQLAGTGVTIHNVPGLHAKVMLFGRHAIVGSANMSGSRLIEICAVTARPEIRSGVASFIAQMARPITKLDDTAIERLCRIKVERKGGRGGPRKVRAVSRMGSTTWIVGSRELVRDPSAVEQKHIDRATTDLNTSHRRHRDDYDWIRWSKGNTFADKCKQGDTIISIWSPRGKGRRYVTRGLPVLLKRNEAQFCRFYLDDPLKDSDVVGWTKFREILSAAGYDRYVGPNSVQALSQEAAEAIDRAWTRSVRKLK